MRAILNFVKLVQPNHLRGITPQIFLREVLGLANYMAVILCLCDERSIFHESKEISFPAAVGGHGVQPLQSIPELHD